MARGTDRVSPITGVDQSILRINKPRVTMACYNDSEAVSEGCLYADWPSFLTALGRGDQADWTAGQATSFS